MIRSSSHASHFPTGNKQTNKIGVRVRDQTISVSVQSSDDWAYTSFTAYATLKGGIAWRLFTLGHFGCLLHARLLECDLVDIGSIVLLDI